jgi:flagella basal body P-ring formation protein FlgA
MTRRMSAAALLALLAYCLQASSAAVTAQWSGGETERVTIVLQSEAVIDDSLVTLGQIARLQGGRDALRKRLGNLDIAEFKLGITHGMVQSEQVRFRLLLAGVEAGQFQLSGAKRTLILESEEPSTFRKIVSAAEQALRARHPGAATLTANRGVNVPVVALRAGEHVRFEAKVKDQGAGRAGVEVALMVNGKTREVVPVHFEIAEAEPAPRTERQDRQGVHTAVYTSAERDARAFLIKTRDNVKIIANIGSARLEALGEALQDGRLGEVIRVRNVESNRIVNGRVQANGMVLVDY